MKYIRGLALIMGFGLGLACGGESDSDDGGGASGAPLDTGLPDATPLENVTPAEYEGACDALRDDVSNRLGPDEAVRGVCEVLSGTTTNVPAECRTEAASCVTDVNSGDHPLITRADLDFTTFECGDVNELEGCAVTVGEFETCLNDRIEVVEKLLADNDCDNAATVDLITAAPLVDLGMTSPPSCARVDAECPNAGPFAGTE
jgi:hypothetical protein